ncbi:hypothetical protein [Aquimarina spongiae]|uniref:Uncharacterized protein n=1 Tax=Aquimarina spongiae TaxID=570521 RepID=A0A1M6BMI9_9FLAO|nr:hypothetical protein [Aquimarina spongiae]SHI49941.1 hypothetical protein SAMN04488508_101914 [Aquimarina spongiae]
MKFRIYCILTAVIFILGCSEGDVIEDNFDFTASVENCSNGDDFVFFKIDPSINQALSLSFTSTTFELNTVPTDLTFSITLNSTSNVLVYRQFDNSIDGNTYFCSSVPPGNIQVTQELISSNGTATITYTELSQTDTDITYTRSIVLENITLIGTEIEVRQERINFGSDEITIPK